MWRCLVLQLIADLEMEYPNKLCIICSKEVIDNDSHLVSPKTCDSWLTLLKAANVRKHLPIIDAAKQLNEEIPEIYLHRKCRSIFRLFLIEKMMKALVMRMLQAHQNDYAEERLSQGFMTQFVFFVKRYASMARVPKHEKNLCKLFTTTSRLNIERMRYSES